MGTNTGRSQLDLTIAFTTHDIDEDSYLDLANRVIVLPAAPTHVGGNIAIPLKTPRA